MRQVLSAIVAAVLPLTLTASAHAGIHPLDCSKKSLGDTISRVKLPNKSIVFTGVCHGPIVIGVDGLTLIGVNGAVIDGDGVGDVVTIEGASRVSLTGVEVRNGLNGIVVTRGGHVTMSGVNAHGNTVHGIVVKTSSTVFGTLVSASQNGSVGLAEDDGAASTLTSSTMTSNGSKDLQLTFESRADLSTTTVGTYTCDATVLVRGTAGISCPH
jgi:hypothetical protein